MHVNDEIRNNETPEMAQRDIVVIGSSAGGIEILLPLLTNLPKKFDGTVFIVQHLAAYYRSKLDTMLNKKSALPVSFAKDGEAFKKGHVYLAPPDHHLLLDRNGMAVKKGPKENRFRPSIDALFRSAAYNFHERVIGIVLSGLLDDGTSGLWSVKRMGGIAVVQDPEDALHPSMPRNAIQNVSVDYVTNANDIPNLMSLLANEKINAEEEKNEHEKELLKKEVLIAAQDNALEMDILKMGKLSPYTCPECHGALVRFTEGSRSRFRCHTGHAFSSTALLAEVSKSIEESFWNTARALEEVTLLLDEKGKNFEAAGDKKTAAQFYKKASQVRDQTHQIRQMIFEHEQLSEEKLEDEK